MLKWTIFLFLLFPGPAFSQKNKADSIDIFLEHWMQSDSIPGALLLITKNGNPVKEKSYGWADPAAKTRLSRTTLFETGEITQLFTALAICQLQEQGKIDLDSSIMNYKDSLTLAWKLVTPRTLLYHCHGLNPEHFDKSKLPGPPGFRYTTAAQIFHLRTMRLYALAGTAVYYSPSAYFLLGMLIEQLSGKPYEEYIREHIYAPAGMEHSSFLNRPKDTGRLAPAFTLAKGKWIPWRLGDLLSPLDCNGFSAVVSSAEELLLLDKALQSNKLVKKETLSRMMEPYIMPDGTPASSGRNRWGMGFYMREIAGHTCMAATSTTGCAYYRFPAEGVSVILLTNLGDGNDYLTNRGANIPYTGYAFMELIARKYLTEKTNH